MIIHHIPIKPNFKGSFKRLVKYLLDPQEKQERVGKVTITNCHSSDHDWAIAEVQATQAKNTRAKGDKNYHVVISFPPGEEVSKKTLAIIESKVVESIGLSEHQRISVVHHDTDSLHVHLAMNKIHPKTYRMVEPFLAYKKFATVAEELEAKFNLVRTNHVPRYKRSENLAHDMERFTGIESLNSWMKQNCLEALLAATSWKELNTLLSENGLRLQKQGNGFIFCSGNNIKVKASSVSRELSKPKLERRLGPFNSEGVSNIASKSTYKKQPIIKDKDTMDLYEQYLNDKEKNSQRISQQLKSLSARKRHMFEKAKKKSKLKRSTIGLMGSGRTSKKVMHNLVSRQYEKEAQKIQQQCHREKEKILNNNPNLSWVDWLQRKANQGNMDAINALRARAAKNHAKYGVSGENQNASNLDLSKVDSVTKNGTVIYKMGECTVKDTGKNLNISQGISEDGLREVLILAIKQFGPCITINGNDVFKRSMARVAVRHNIEVIFSDTKTEEFKNKNREAQNERSRQSNNRDQRRANGSDAVPRRRFSFKRYKDGNGGNTPRERGINESNDCRFRQGAPAESQDGLRAVSELNVVQFPGGSEVLLQDHAHAKLEREGTQSDNKVRRSIFGWKIGRKSKTSPTH